jgi:uncharacterized membrane protein YraQ (UPF0718 family)
MKKNIPDWLVQIIWFTAGLFGTGAFWYFLSVKNSEATIISGIAAVVLALLAAFLHRINDQSSRLLIHREKISSFIAEGHALAKKSNEKLLPIKETNIWVSDVENYLRLKLDQSFVSRFNDFSGMVFYGDGSEKSNYKTAIDGRLRRLNQFLAELV